jgi:class 3 adenylate cyclase
MVDPLKGTTASRYTILDKLGEGGMGVVYSARDTTLDRLVALKFLPSRLSNSKRDRDRLLNEAKAAAQLNHPNICAVYEIEEEERQLFIVMELLEGTTLRQKIQQGPLPMKEIIDIAVSVSSALATAHGKGIIHRDIKPENIMISPAGGTKIMDFGVARFPGGIHVGREESTGGTVAYMSPEQSRGEEVDRRTDIWSSGVVLYEMAAGVPPFGGHYEESIIYQVLNEQPRLPSEYRMDVSPLLEDIILKALEKNPSARYQTMDEMLTDLRLHAREITEARGTRSTETPGARRLGEVRKGKRFERERRQVTMLFAGLTGIGNLYERSDPEVASQMIAGCMKGLRDIAEKFEGLAERFLEDSLMTVFGAPIAHEDDPERAVRCSLEMMGFVRGYGAFTSGARPATLGLHIGIHTGFVIAGSDDNEHGSGYAVVGQTANVAAGMIENAESGEICISENTRKMLISRIEATGPFTVTVRGLKLPLNVFKVRALAGLEESAGAGETTIVGRRRELRTIGESIEQIRRKGEARLFIRGEAGVGKSCLKGGLLRTAGERSVVAFEGRCSSFETTTPYFVWNMLLRNILRLGIDVSETETKTRLTAMLRVMGVERDEPYLAALCSLRYEEILLEVDRVRKQRIFEAALNLLRAQANRQTTVFILEDLHWIDQFSQELLEFVFNQDSIAPALFVLITRPEYSHAQKLFVRGTILDLNRLDHQETALLAKMRFGADEIPQEVEDLIEKRSEGNPFFAEEIIKILLDRKLVGVSKRRVELRVPHIDSGIPDTIQGVLMARIDRVEEGFREVLLNASVIGREFARSILDSIIDRKIDVGKSLQELQSLDLILEAGDARELEYLFKHCLIQEVAYNTLLTQKRKRLHGVIAQAIEQLYVDRLPEFYQLLGFHYEKAEQWQKAAQYLSMAGMKVREMYTGEESREYFQRKDAAIAKLFESGSARRIGWKILSWVFASGMLAIACSASIFIFRGLSPHATAGGAVGIALFLLCVLLPPGMMWGGSVLAIRAFPGLRGSPALYELLEDRIQAIYSTGRTYVIHFSDIMTVSYFRLRIHNTLRRSFRSSFTVLSSALPWKVQLFAGRDDLAVPVSLGFAARNGSIHIRRVAGNRAPKFHFIPWKITPDECKDIEISPSQPREFFNQLRIALERWRQFADGGTAKRKNDKPAVQGGVVLVLTPKFRLTSNLATIFPIFFLTFVPSVFLAGIAAFQVKSMVLSLLFLMPTVMALRSILNAMRKKKRNYAQAAFRFYPERLDYRAADDGVIDGSVEYSEIHGIKLLTGFPQSLFRLGTIEIITTRSLDNSTEMPAANVLYVPDIEHPGEMYARLLEIVQVRSVNSSSPVDG